MAFGFAGVARVLTCRGLGMICSVMTCSVLKQFGALDLGKVFGSPCESCQI